MPIPYLTLADPRAAIALYQVAFGAEEVMLMEGPGGMVMHAELAIEGGRLMLSGEFPGFSSAPDGRCPVNFMMYVQDVDVAYARAVDAGMEPLQAPEDQFWGDRTAKVNDGMGYEWTLGFQVEVVSADEITKRAAAYAAEMGG